MRFAGGCVAYRFTVGIKVSSSPAFSCFVTKARICTIAFANWELNGLLSWVESINNYGV